MKAKIQKNIIRYGLLSDSQSLIVALSGGADSVALLAVLSQLGYRCIAAHCNFHLRGDESNRDESHAISVSHRFGVECKVAHFDVKSYEKEHGVSTEMACRELRYEWFEQLREQYGAQAIAVAHHRDDDIETMFLNLLRGSGIAGAAAMKWKNGYVVRPMLDIPRTEVIDYLREIGVEYVVDSTNEENDFKRNRLRNQVLPMLNECFPGAQEMLSKSLCHLKDHRKIYDEAIKGACDKYKKGNIIKLGAIVGQYVAPSTLLFEMLNPLGFNQSQVESIVDSVGNSGRKFYASDWVAIVDRSDLQLVKRDKFKDDAEYIIKISDNEKPCFAMKQGSDIIAVESLPIDLQMKIVEREMAITKANRDEIFLDACVLEDNPQFILRHWREGDRIAPFGMRGTKKLSDIFSDAKLSLLQKEKVWVLEHNGVILWVVGMRASRHFAIKGVTKRILWIKNLQGGL